MSDETTIEDSRRLYVTMSRCFKQYKDERLRLKNVTVCLKAGIPIDGLFAAQNLLVSAGLLEIRYGVNNSTYIRGGRP
jgi:hypothetical protein